MEQKAEMKNIRQLSDGEWMDVTEGTFSGCCDCGLVHECNYELLKNKDGSFSIMQQMFRNNRKTGARRRLKKARKEGVFERKKK